MPKLRLPILLLACSVAIAFAEPADAPRHTQAPDAILLTIFLHHDQSKTLDEINKLGHPGSGWVSDETGPRPA